jgi:hypothetical protein
VKVNPVVPAKSGFRQVRPNDELRLSRTSGEEREKFMSKGRGYPKITERRSYKCVTIGA